MKKLLILIPLLTFSCKKEDHEKFLCDCFTRWEQKNTSGQFELQLDYGAEQDTCSEASDWFYDTNETNRWKRICN